MDGIFRNLRLLAVLRAAGVMAASIGVAFGHSAGSAQPIRAASELLEDATLHDVIFIDPDRGWAVGDRGAIWRTEDGGRRWVLQDSPVSCRLHAICFLNDVQGWIVGGRTHPYTHKSSGVVLRTDDGGRTWRSLATSAIPALRRIKMFDAKHGWAVGAASALYPAGVYRTEDGGRGWATTTESWPDGWLSGDFITPTRGVVAGRSAAAVVAFNRVQGAVSWLGRGHVVRQVRWADENQVWVAGDRGLAVAAHASAEAFAPVPETMAPSEAALFDFAALAVCGPHVWIAGAPGSRVFHSADNGVTWDAFTTDQTLPLHALYFLDEHRGWAVGALGTILATRDGGRTWSRQRSGGTRLAALGIYTDPQATSWELFARLSGNEGYLAAAEYLVDRDHDRSAMAETARGDRAHEAMVLVGGCYANAASLLPHTRDTQRPWEEYVVRKLRQWRPEMVIISASAAREDKSTAKLINQIILNAVSRAQDAAAYPEHLHGAGLAPWTVKRLFSEQPPGETGSVALTTASLAPQLGGTLADAATPARALFDEEYHASPTKIEFQRLIDRIAAEKGASSDFVSGLILHPGGEARRRPATLTAGNLDLVARNAQKQRNIQHILAHSVENSSDATLGQVDELIRGFSDQTAGEILFQLAERLRHQGRPEQAAEVYQQLLSRHPQHELCEAASWRLLQFYSSSEVSWRLASQTVLRQGSGSVQLASYDGPTGEDGEKPALLAPRVPVQLRGSAATASEVSRRDRDDLASRLGQRIAQSHPALFAEPAVRLSLATAARRQGDKLEPERLIRQLAVRNDPFGWRQCAEAELWLMKPTAEPPKALLRCRLAKEKPYLDGQLDDEVWRKAQHVPTPQSFSSPGAEGMQGGESALPPTTVLVTRDEEFLYFAAHCAKAPAAAYPASDQQRTYDAPLEQRDRVELRLDLDRDYATWFRLSIDYRGWTGDACLEDPSWNPQWYVASSSDNQSWTVEAAIPLNQIAPQPPQRYDVWAVSGRRVLPNADHGMAIANPAAPARPQDFALLLFE